MKRYKNLSEILSDRENLDWYGSLFVNHENWATHPESAEILYLEGDDELMELVDYESMLPKLAQQNNVKHLLDNQVFEDIVLKQEELKTSSSIVDYIYAINYYREYDTFYWLKK